ncbi:CesT family type III secretion system chaperone [Aquabacterium sp. A7-Y]|uniref:CesT family type III secretion system chaperone n=1 Tax=Aquabacterium sp. A7-Y TaxID=1349605 RepID=UPI00223D8F6D|nr:CesT family type III secretion system chaperone [Aquabacterium sp. A7-Y]MCW7536969.1 CesT family type III secretion system chaperone [Aquabacterium sp. A7-Y]
MRILHANLLEPASARKQSLMQTQQLVLLVGAVCERLGVGRSDPHRGWLEHREVPITVSLHPRRDQWLVLVAELGEPDAACRRQALELMAQANLEAAGPVHGILGLHPEHGRAVHTVATPAEAANVAQLAALVDALAVHSLAWRIQVLQPRGAQAAPVRAPDRFLCPGQVMHADHG